MGVFTEAHMMVFWVCAPAAHVIDYACGLCTSSSHGCVLVAWAPAAHLTELWLVYQQFWQMCI